MYQYPPGIGVRPKAPKLANEIRKQQRERAKQLADEERARQLADEERARRIAEEERARQEANEERKQDEYRIILDLKESCGLSGVPIADQNREICWAIVLGFMVEALANKDKPENQYKRLDTTAFIQNCKPKDRVMDDVTSMKSACRYLRYTGLPKLDARNNPSTQTVVKRHLKVKDDADSDFIVDHLEQRGPLALVLNVEDDFETLGTGICSLPVLNVNAPKHAVLIVGYGSTKGGELYFVVRNSWGSSWGDKGYGKIFINGNCMVVHDKD